MDRFDPFVKYADVYGDIINWEKDPMNKPQNQNKYFFSDGKTYYEQICKMLRLMSVFKEAFNQIYSNEDEISEAWENFVNNLSASVVEGSEPDVTLTWTDDSVNFEFTMVPGVPGEQGVGITSISFNSDYTMTITLSDGNTYTSMSLKGETGPQGPQGETGSGLQILDVYATLADLQSAHPTGQPGDAYQVGSEGNYTLYIWSSSQSAWIPAGSLGTVSPSTSNPLMNGTASAGSSDLYSRGDHVHPSDTSRASKEEMDALIKTSKSLIDQSFTYRENPAIQDGLARIDKIKGNTLVWNQLIENGNFASTSGWQNNSWDSFTVSGNVGKIIATGVNRGTYAMVDLIQGHKYLLMAEVNSSQPMNVGINELGGRTQTTVTNQYITVSKVATASASGSKAFALYSNSSSQNTMNVRNCMLIDLTLLNASYITDYNSFKSYFPLSYYSYQSTLLSFKGTGIKTVGKNLFHNTTASATNNGITWTVNEDGSVTANGTCTTNVSVFKMYTPLIPAGTYIINGTPSGSAWGGSNPTWRIRLGHQDGSYINDVYAEGRAFTLTQDEILEIQCNIAVGKTVSNQMWFPMITFQGADSTFEPYKETITNLPTLTYFPNGMKSAGNVYDELLPNKAITRVGMVDLGSLTWEYFSGSKIFQSNVITDAKTGSGYDSVANIKCAKYQTLSRSGLWDDTNTIGIELNPNGFGEVGRLWVRDTAYTTAEAFKSAMSGVYVYYELATPTETSIDIDLSFNAYVNGTEQLLPVNASVPSTSPIIADMTYLSIDDAMEYIIDKLANVPLNTQQILDSLEDDVADLQTDVGTLQPAVSALQTSVGNINTNIGQLSSTVAGHTSSISDMQSDISDLDNSITSLEGTVTNNTSRIGTLESGLSTTNGNVENLSTSVSDLDDTVTEQGTTVTALDSIISDISNNPVVSALGSHELGFVAAYVEATLAANAGTRVTIPKPVIFPNNYTPLFIVGMSTGSSDVSICEIPPTFGSRDSVSCRVWNHGSQQTAQITVYILCMRQRQSQ